MKTKTKIRMEHRLPFEIQMQIIEKKLPIKSLIRFQLVNKAWKSFIISSKFIARYSFSPTHLLISYQIGEGVNTEGRYVFFVDDDTFPQRKLSPIVPPLIQQLEKQSFIGTSHGLLCVSGYSQQKKIAFIWNPAIRKSIGVVLPTTASTRSSILGFGVSPKTNDPMLINITKQVSIFTLSSREWRPPRGNLYPCKLIHFTPEQIIIDFREIDLPDWLANMDDTVWRISKLRESLVVLEFAANTIMNEDSVIWMMEDGDFKKMYTIKVPDLSRSIGFRMSGEPIIHVGYYKARKNEFIVYEPSSKNFKDVIVLENTDGTLFPYAADSYTESLLLLDYDNGHIVSCGDAKN